MVISIEIDNTVQTVLSKDIKGKLTCVAYTPLATVCRGLKFSLEIVWFAESQLGNSLFPQGFEIKLSGAASSGAKGLSTQCCVSDRI